MKLIITLLLISINCSLWGQSIFFHESKVIDFNVPRSSDSYERRIVRISENDTLVHKLKYPITLDWQPISENETIGCNAWLCGKLNIETSQFDTLFYSEQGHILELTSNDFYCYVLTSPNEMERFKDFEVLRINLKNHRIEKFFIPQEFNILNFNASNNNLALIDYDYNEQDDNETTELIIYNLQTKVKTSVGFAHSYNDERLGGGDNGSVMQWIGDSNLYYSRKNNGNEKRIIYNFNINDNKTYKSFEIPYPNIDSFSLLGQSILITDGNRIIKVDKFGKETILYKVKYKYDYIGMQLYTY